MRTMEKHKESTMLFSSEIQCRGLAKATEEARRQVQESDPAVMLQADACLRTRSEVWTKYRCWINERGEFVERKLI